MNRTLPKRIFICGFMGAGKSTIGREVARQLEYSFYDLDDLIEERSKQSIAQTFKASGEAAFRRIEKSVLLDTIREKEGIVALGGGTLQNQHMVDHIKVNGLLAFIDAPFTVMIHRIMQNDHRPLLLDQNGTMKPKEKLKDELNKLYEARLPFYEQAEVRLPAPKNASIREISEQLVKKIKYHVALH